jgi:hypothetical protein
MKQRLLSRFLLASIAVAGCAADNGTAATGGPGGAGSPTAGSGGATAAGGGGAPADAGGHSDAAAGSAGQGTGGSSAEAGNQDAADGGTNPTGDPMLLSQTGLYTNVATGELAPGVEAYQPQFALWSDSATKERWIKLPPGSKIDTSDMNYWVYPIDTKLFKEFTRDGVRVETRMIWKHGAGDWFMMAYKWNDQQDEAVAVPNGEMNASGTLHDIPAQEGCTTCHGTMKDRVLGFTAIQLSHGLPGINLMQASSMGWFTNPPAANFVVPGDAVDRAALGYLHANCGLCHNDKSKVFLITVDVNTWLDTSKLGTVAETPIYTTLVNKPTTGSISRVSMRIAPGNPADSAVHELMSLRGDVMRQMPPTGTELVDTDGVAAVDAWINKPPQ